MEITDEEKRQLRELVLKLEAMQRRFAEVGELDVESAYVEFLDYMMEDFNA